MFKDKQNFQCVSNIDNKKLSGGGYSSERIEYIDSLKGFAILCVVLGHVADSYYLAETYPNDMDVIWNIYNLIYAFHMPLFMMISGFVYKTAYIKGVPDKTRIIKQIYNLIAVYVIFSVLFGLFKIACSRFTYKQTSIIDVLLIWIKPIAPYWYLYVLIVLYLIFMMLMMHKLNVWIQFGLLAMLAMAVSFLDFNLFEVKSICYYAVFFYTGIIYEQITHKGRITIVLFMVAVILLVIFFNNEERIAGIPIVNLCVAMGVSLGLWYAFKNTHTLAESRPLRFLGRSSLEIYVIHCVFIAGIRPITIMLGITNAYISILINFTLATTIPILFAMVCKKLNVYGLFFKPITYIQNLKND